MSLTSHLNSADSPVLKFFKNNFNFDSFIREENAGLAGSYTIKPKVFNNYPWSDMG